MKKTLLLKILIPVLIIAIVAITFARTPIFRHVSTPSAAIVPPVENGPVYAAHDEGMLRELMGVYARIDSVEELYLVGRLDAQDPADSAAELHNRFRFCKRKNECYYQTGDMEMIALENVYISVSKQAKKIFVGPARKVISPFRMATDSMVDIWRKDNYLLETNELPGKTTVRLLCANHITCKEYRYEYNPLERTLKGVYMKLTNLNDPLNTAMDKEVNMTVDEWKEKDIPKGLLRAESYLVKRNAGWEPAPAYSNYTLISLF